MSTSVRFENIDGTIDTTLTLSGSVLSNIGLIAKLDTNGKWIYSFKIEQTISTGLPSASGILDNRISVDRCGNLYLMASTSAGTSTGEDNFLFYNTRNNNTPNNNLTILDTTASSNVLVIAKYNINAKGVWSTKIITQLGADLFLSAIAANDFSVYVTGYWGAISPIIYFYDANDLVNPNPNLTKTNVGTNNTHDGFLVKYDIDGMGQWTIQLSSSDAIATREEDQPAQNGIILDDCSNVYIIAATRGANNVLISDTVVGGTLNSDINLTALVASDYSYMAKFNSDGRGLWSARFATTQDPVQIYYDYSCENIYLHGSITNVEGKFYNAQPPNNIIEASDYTLTGPLGISENYIVRYNKDGYVTYSTKLEVFTSMQIATNNSSQMFVSGIYPTGAPVFFYNHNTLASSDIILPLQVGSHLALARITNDVTNAKNIGVVQQVIGTPPNEQVRVYLSGRVPYSGTGTPMFPGREYYLDRDTGDLTTDPYSDCCENRSIGNACSSTSITWELAPEVSKARPCQRLLDGNTTTTNETDVLNAVAQFADCDTLGLDFLQVDNVTKLYNVVASDVRNAYGATVSISGDYFVVGDSYYASDSGIAYIYRDNQLVKSITASDQLNGRQFGTVTVISGDIVAVSAPLDNPLSITNAGSVYIFQKDLGGADNWGTVQRIYSSDAAINSFFGISLSIAGNTLVVGETASSRGHVHIFKNSPSDNLWGEVKKLTFQGSDSIFGISTTICGDTLAVGSSLGAVINGSVTIFDRNTGGNENWGQTQRILNGPSDYGFGGSISLSGNILAIGGIYSEKVYVYERTTANDLFVNKQTITATSPSGPPITLTPSDGINTFGAKVGVSGYTIIVGQYNFTKNYMYYGAFHLYQKNFSTTQWEYKISVLNDSSINSYLGYGVAISGDKAIAGGPSITTQISRGLVVSVNSEYKPLSDRKKVLTMDYETNEICWIDQNAVSQVQCYQVEECVTQFNDTSVLGLDFSRFDNVTRINNLTNSDSTSLFGATVAISGDYFIIGDYNYNSGISTGNGKAYLYKNNNLIKTFQPSDLTYNLLFAAGVTISGDIMAIGAPFEQSLGILNSGSTYIYMKDQGGIDNWGLVKNIHSSDIGLNYLFGGSVALSQNTLVVGENAAAARGYVHIFDRNNGGFNQWNETKRLTFGSSDIGFGFAITICDDTIVVGAPNVSKNNVYPASVTVYNRNLGGLNNWGQRQRIINGSSDVAFGYAVSISNNILCVGTYSNKMYIYERYQDEGIFLLYQTITPTSPVGPPISTTSGLFTFGSTVAICGYSIIIGEYNYKSTTISGNDLGAVHMYQKNFNTLQWEYKSSVINDILGNLPAASSDNLGLNVAISSNKAIAGAGGLATGLGFAILLESGYTPESSKKKVLTLDYETNAVSWIDENAVSQVNCEQVEKCIENIQECPIDFNCRLQKIIQCSDNVNFGQSVDISGDCFIVGASAPLESSDMLKSVFEQKTFFNTNGITIPTSGSATPYPSIIEITGIMGKIRTVEVTLIGFTHSFPNDCDMMLVHPDGITNIQFMTATGGTGGVTNVTYTFTDSAAIMLPNATSPSGSYLPTNLFSGTYPPPAPTGSTTTLMNIFNNLDPNGQWKLYIVDHAPPDGGMTGWSLTITTSVCNRATVFYGNRFHKLTPSDINNNIFGSSVSISGDTAIVSAPGDDTVATNAGAAYVFDRHQGGSNNWGPIKKIFGSDTVGNSFFGTGYIDICNDTIAIGSRLPTVVHIFERNYGGMNNWGEVIKITGSDAVNNSIFGTVLALCDNYLVVGDESYNGNRGRAFVFSRNVGGQNNWGELQRFTGTIANIRVGGTVSISENVMCITTRNAALTTTGVNIYVKSNDGYQWIYETNVTPTPITAGQYNLLIDNTNQTIVIGNNQDNVSPFTITGSYSIFQRNEYTTKWESALQGGLIDVQSSLLNLGYDVAISGDKIILGAPDFGSNRLNRIALISASPKCEDGAKKLVSKDICGDICLAEGSEIPANYIASNDLTLQNVTISGVLQTNQNAFITNLFQGFEQIIVGDGIATVNPSLKVNTTFINATSTGVAATGGDMNQGLYAGQIKYLISTVFLGTVTYTITPVASNIFNQATVVTTITFNGIGQSIALIWNGQAWFVMYNYGTTIA